MYRIILAYALVAVCVTAPSHGGNNQVSMGFQQRRSSKSSVPFDDSDTIDNSGGGYSYFKKQQIDFRPVEQPNIQLSSQDLTEYMKSSAFKHNSASRIANSYESRDFHTGNDQRSNPGLHRFHHNPAPAFNQIHNAYGQMTHHDVQPFHNSQNILIPRTQMNDFNMHMPSPNSHSHGPLMNQGPGHFPGNNIVFPHMQNTMGRQPHVPRNFGGW